MDMKKLTKAELVAALVERNAQLEAANLRIATLTGDVEALRAQVHRFVTGETVARTQQKPRTETRKVYEFDPNIPGDFARANKEARDNHGICRRIGVGAPQ